MSNSNVGTMFIVIACFLIHPQQSREKPYVIDVAQSSQIMKRTETNVFKQRLEDIIWRFLRPRKLPFTLKQQLLQSNFVSAFMVFLHVSHFKCLEENWKTKFDSIICQIVAIVCQYSRLIKTVAKRFKTKTRSHVLDNCKALLSPCLRCWQACRYLKGCWLCLFSSHRKNSCHLDINNNKRIPENDNQNEVNDFYDTTRLNNCEDLLESLKYFLIWTWSWITLKHCCHSKFFSNSINVLLIVIVEERTSKKYYHRDR